MGHFLKSMTYPDQPRSPPTATVGQMRQTAIIEAPPHPQTITFGVKSHQRQDQQIQFTHRTVLAGRHLRLGNAKAIMAQDYIGVKGRKAQAARKMPGEHGQIKMLIGRNGMLHDRQGTDFTLHGPVEADMASPLKVVETHQMVRQGHGCGI